MKKLEAVVLTTAVTAFMLAGCGNTKAETAATNGTSSEIASTDTSGDGESELLKEIKERGYITVGSSNDAPFFYQDAATGELEGLDYEILSEVCKRLEIPEIRMQTIDFSNLLVELNNKNIDIVADAMYIKDERLQLALFSDVWYTEGEAVVVPTGSEYTTKDSLVKATVGAQPGTTFYDTADAWKSDGKIKDLVSYENQATLMTAVNTGKVDAVVTDGIVAAYTLGQDSSLNLQLMSPYEAEASGNIGAAVRFEDKEFLNEINGALNDMKEDGTLLKILQDFGLTEDYFVGVEEGKTNNIQ